MWSYSPEQVLQFAQQWWGWHPHPAQREWLLDTHPIKVAACGRRWGKTESLAVETAALAVLHPSLRQVIVAPTIDQACILFERTAELLNIWAEKQQGVLKRRNTPYPRLWVNGGEIVARSAHRQAHTLRGRSAHRIVVDEAAYLSPEVIPRVLLPMLADTEGQLVLLSTPFGKNHFWEWFVRGQSGDWCRSFRFPTSSNPNISAAFLQMQRQMLSERQFAIEYEALFVDDAGAVFTQEVIEGCVQPRLANLTPSAVDYTIAGLDWGRYHDYTAVAIVTPRDNMLQTVWLRRLPHATWNSQVERVLSMMQEWKVRRLRCDATGVGDPLVEMLQQRVCERGIGVLIQPVVFTTSTKRQIVENLALWMEQGRLAIPPEPELMRELHAFTASHTPSGQVRLQAASGAHDDLVVALALAAYGELLLPPSPDRLRPLTSGRHRQANSF